MLPERGRAGGAGWVEMLDEVCLPVLLAFHLTSTDQNLASHSPQLPAPGGAFPEGYTPPLPPVGTWEQVIVGDSSQGICACHASLSFSLCALEAQRPGLGLFSAKAYNFIDGTQMQTQVGEGGSLWWLEGKGSLAVGRFPIRTLR